MNCSNARGTRRKHAVEVRTVFNILHGPKMNDAHASLPRLSAKTSCERSSSDTSFSCSRTTRRKCGLRPQDRFQASPVYATGHVRLLTNTHPQASQSSSRRRLSLPVLYPVFETCAKMCHSMSELPLPVKSAVLRRCLARTPLSSISFLFSCICLKTSSLRCG